MGNVLIYERNVDNVELYEESVNGRYRERREAVGILRKIPTESAHI
jgi:hypothetical protein